MGQVIGKAPVLAFVVRQPEVSRFVHVFRSPSFAGSTSPTRMDHVRKTIEEGRAFRDSKRPKQLAAARFNQHPTIRKEDGRNCSVAAVDCEDGRHGRRVAVEINLVVIDAGALQHPL